MGFPIKLFILCLYVIQASSLTPCLQIPEVNPRRYATFGDHTFELKLGVTERVTHKLATQIFYLFLKEVLGYDDVAIVPISAPDNNTNIFNTLKGDLNRIHLPEYMMNLEVWISHDVNTAHLNELYQIKECNNIGPIGRYGWFVPIRLYNRLNRPNINHWEVFKYANMSSAYSLSPELMSDVNSYTKDSKNSYYCKETFCSEGLFVPERCKKVDCAVLIAEYGSSTKFVVDDIEKLNLYVTVVWVGPHQATVARIVTESLLNQKDNKLAVFLSYSPGILVSQEEHISINFPACDSFVAESICSYEAYRLLKFSWGNMEFSAHPAYEALENMALTVSDYKELLTNYIKAQAFDKSDDEVVYEVACNWMKAHQYKQRDQINSTSLDTWMPSNDHRNELLIGGIFPLHQIHNLEAGIAFASFMAVHAVNENPLILRDYNLRILVNNGLCKTDFVMNQFFNYITSDEFKRMAGILGPACSDTVEPLAGIAKHFKMLVVSYSAEGSSFSDRKKYPYFYRTIGENKNYMYVYLQLMKNLGWRRVASLTEDGTKYTEYISMTEDLLRNNSIKFVANRKFPQDWETSTMREYLENFKNNLTVRIIIADVKDEAARAIMCEAYHLEMTAKQGYVWFLPVWLSPLWYNTTIYNQTAEKRSISCNTSQMLEAINGHLAVSHAFFAPNDSIMQENITVQEWRENYIQKCKVSGTIPSDYAGYAYDAVWAYAYAVDALVKENQSYASDFHSSDASERLLSLFQNTNFNGTSGHIQFRSGSSRYTTIHVLQWLNHNRSIVGVFNPNATTKEYKTGVLKLGHISWLSGSLPWDGTPDEPKCIIEGFAKLLNADCQVAVIVANIIGIGVLMLVVLVGFLIVKHRYDEKVQLTQKYMKSLGIDLLSVSSMGGGLDKWEIPKDRVVINRKLGEGAFGTVYGGEAYFDERGWVAVAVKTLKAGSTTEEKLDFLSEAEVMKRFEHKNIVQLLGVCTKNDPFYTIMEFMLYGDLKTFLLARRHLVNEKLAEDSDEISSKKLTSMALDVARALSYLAELKYVHRDVASRNCLVNLSKVVKLGDFGMTRPMFENDYYKFNRKGMLPVRWMAPESLSLGIFTPASDVWSFGVLLYEIITFGSFPFGGMNNNQVLEHVKAGNTLTIPRGVKPQLETLIKSCWHLSYKERPQASEIVEFLANNPRLIAPCLDVPLSSVQLDDTDPFDLSGLPIGFQDKPRKFSMTLRQRTPSTTSEAPRWNEVASEPLLPAPVVVYRNTEEPFQTDSLL